jgi:NADPH:quinone reductase-like Zn-dependent oxidoreductase
MKAYRLDDFTSLDDLHLRDEVDPHPQRGEVLVRVHAVSLNFRDIAMIRGRYPQTHRKGLIPTSDGAGEIIEVGADIDDFKLGDRVMGTFHPRWYGGRLPQKASQHDYGSEQDGWLAERKVVSRESLVRIPNHLSYEEASTLPCAALTAWSALTLGTPIRAGHNVLTQGTGGVSLFALQLAKAVGATVIATTSSAAKADKLRSLGADEVVNYKEEPHWGARARDITGGLGVDRVVEVGGPGTIHESLRAVRPGGEIASVGFLSSENKGIDFFELFASGATFRHISVGSREGLQDVARTIASTSIKPVIDRVFGFKEAKEAYARLESGSRIGKVVILCSVP